MRCGSSQGRMLDAKHRTVPYRSAILCGSEGFVALKLVAGRTIQLTPLVEYTILISNDDISSEATISISREPNQSLQQLYVVRVIIS